MMYLNRWCVLIVLLACISAKDINASERPNILFIYSDDQNYNTLSCYPESPDWVQTPHIDSLAKQGVRFERTYLGAWCMPSRASFLTGRLQHGIQSMRMEGEYPGSTYDPEQCRFWPSVLKANGYHTAQIGKWHTGVDTGNGRDWNHQIVWNRPAHPDNAGHYFYDQIVTFNGKDRRVEGYSTDNYTDWAVDYIKGEQRDAEKPWYLWLCYGAIHGPTTPAERHEGNLKGKESPVPADIFGPWPGKPQYLEKTSSWQEGPDGKAYRQKKKLKKSNFNTNTAGQGYQDWVQQYNECVMAIDEGVGRLIETLRETGQLENTLIVYTADQGFALGQHGLNSKVAPYDAAVASPLIISHPATLPQGQVCSHPVNAPDIVSFFCSTAGVEIPWRTDGRDIRPLLEDPVSSEWTQPMIMTHTGRKYGADTDSQPDKAALYQVGNIPWYVLLRDGKYKYVRYLVEGEIEEVYDLDADPEELTNLATHKKFQSLLGSLRQKAVDELRRTDAGFVDTMPQTAAMKEGGWCMKTTLSERVQNKRRRTAIVFHASTILLIFFVWSIAAPSPALCASADEGGGPFDVYAVDGSGEQVIHVGVRPNGSQAQLVREGVIALPGKPHGIAKNPAQSSLIVTLLGKGTESPRAVTLGVGSEGKHSIVGVADLQDSTGYTSFDRTGKYFLTSSYHDGHFDVYQVKPDGVVSDRVSHRQVAEKYAHSVLTTPDNRFLYVPCVKEFNAIYQYAFDEETGNVKPLEPFDAKPPHMFGPRHIAYHPDRPYVYFSNEQQLGVSAYRIDEDGQLAALQHATTIPRRSPYTAGVRDMHASDIAVTEDGKFLFLALRDFVGNEDSVFMFRVADDGRLSLVSRKHVGDIPWCLRVSPNDSHLLVSESRDKTLAVLPIQQDGSLGDAVRMDWGSEVRNMVIQPLSGK